jgi:epoxyqueuosine reductase
VARALAPLDLEWGLAPLAPSDLAGTTERLSGWVERGMHGGMDWYPESVAVRGDPWREWPWTRSVLAIRWNYPLPGPEERGVRPVVAGYARVRDYHEVVSEALRAACALLTDEFPGLRTRWFCDALPVQEVRLAELCGLGWRGRNGLLLDRKAGSAFHLGGILLSLEGVDAPPKALDHCGSCTACVDACPSRAIVAPGVVDASRCLSQWSIEDRRTPEGPAADASGGEIFGCDICQQACPWNRKVLTESVYPEGWPSSWEEWIATCLPRSGFQSRFRDTPLDRPGRAKVLRVLLRSLWNVDRERARPLLRATAFEEDRPALRAWARELLASG